MSYAAGQAPIFSVICPVFNEEATVPLFFERIEKVFHSLAPGIESQLIFVDNRSTDRTRDEVKKLADVHPFVCLVALSKNVGYQRSIECGLRTARGNYFAIID